MKAGKADSASGMCSAKIFKVQNFVYPLTSVLLCTIIHKPNKAD